MYAEILTQGPNQLTAPDQQTLAVNTLAIFDVLHIETSFTDQWLVYATHEDVLPAMTAAMAFVQNAKPCPMALKLAGRAFRKVNQAISNNHAERTPLILAIIWLSVIAVSYESPTQARADCDIGLAKRDGHATTAPPGAQRHCAGPRWTALCSSLRSCCSGAVRETSLGTTYVTD